MLSVMRALPDSAREYDDTLGAPFVRQAFEVAGTRRTSPFSTAGAGEASLKEFTCLRIDGSVPTSMRCVFPVFPHICASSGCHVLLAMGRHGRVIVW